MFKACLCSYVFPLIVNEHSKSKVSGFNLMLTKVQLQIKHIGELKQLCHTRMKIEQPCGGIVIDFCAVRNQLYADAANQIIKIEHATPSHSEQLFYIAKVSLWEATCFLSHSLTHTDCK